MNHSGVTNFDKMIALMGTRGAIYSKILIENFGGRLVRIPKKHDDARKKYLYGYETYKTMPNKQVRVILGGITDRYFRILRAEARIKFAPTSE